MLDRIRTAVARASLAIPTIAAVLPALCTDPVAAHDGYAEVMTPDGRTSCCDDKDCSVVPWRETEHGLEYKLDGFWVRGQEHNQLYQPIDDQAHACWERESAPPNARCLIPPGMGW